MHKKDFYFSLPLELIAQYPLNNRTDSRLMVYHRTKNTLQRVLFKDIIDFLHKEDLLVLNDSKVIPARLRGNKSSGGKVEILVERIIDERNFFAHIRSSKAMKPDTIIYFPENLQIRVLKKNDDLYLCCSDISVDNLLDKIGHIPLPPYIARADEAKDYERYQTVYGKYKGSIAAPTAGLHFDASLLEKIRQKGINIAYTTLHVGSGTFRPVRVDNIDKHSMHTERMIVSSQLCEMIHQTKAKGRKVIAVGTTALRSLETAAESKGILKPYQGETDIFIKPGYNFKICDGLITNFHLPESTLLMLVAAFIGHAPTMKLYQEAIKQKYRFFSYGDTSLLL